jgi:hypothetical protein
MLAQMPQPLQYVRSIATVPVTRFGSDVFSFLVFITPVGQCFSQMPHKTHVFSSINGRTILHVPVGVLQKTRAHGP